MNATRTLDPSPRAAPPLLADDVDAAALEDALDESTETDVATGSALTAHAAPPALPAAPDEARLAAWIDAIVDHDERALAALYDATLARVYGLVLRVVRRPALAEEVVEDTYFQVWRQAARFDPARGRALTWLLGMARSRAIDALRREARFEHDGLDDDAANERPSDDAGSDELLAATRQHAELHQALLQLQAQPRQLVAMAFLRGLSHEEIASQTLLPLGTVKSQIRRALILLREVLATRGPASAQLS